MARWSHVIEATAEARSTRTRRTCEKRYFLSLHGEVQGSPIPANDLLLGRLT